MCLFSITIASRRVSRMTDRNIPVKSFLQNCFADCRRTIPTENYDETDNPFFLYLSFTSPHDPRTPPARIRRRCIHLRRYLSQKTSFSRNTRSTMARCVSETKYWHPSHAPREIVQQHIADYYGMITHMDAEIGRVLQYIRGDWTSRIIRLSSTPPTTDLLSDNTDCLGKQNLYNHSIHVPSIFAGPGVPEGA